MNEHASPVASPVTCNSNGLAWKVPVAVILGPVCVLVGFIGEAVGLIVGFSAVAVCFLLAQFFLSRGLSLRQSRPILFGINALPLCLGIVVIFVEQKSGAWTQGVTIVLLSLTCSLAAAIVASRLARDRAR